MTKLVPWPSFSCNAKDTDINYFSLAALFKKKNIHEKLIQHLFKVFTKEQILLSAKVKLTELQYLY